MSKNNFPTRVDPINLPRRLREGLEKADNLLSGNEPQQALDLLEELDKKFPRQPEVLSLKANAYIDIGNEHGYLHTMYYLHNLTPNRAEVKLGLAVAYLNNGQMALALQTFRQFLKQWPRDERGAEIRVTIPELERGLAKMLGELDFTLEAGLEFASKHEELQVLMELGDYQHSKHVAKILLEQRPNFVPALNNLSQVYWLEGNLAAAIESSNKVLDIQPDNVHALSNLTRFLFMQGKEEAALAFAKRLKDSNADATDRWVKKAEALSFIEDDEGVLALLDESKHAGEFDQLNESVWHWCAVAEYRKGNIAKARTYWKKTLKLAPYSSFASDNLEELKKPLHERTCPQAFSLDMWLPSGTIKDLSSAVDRAAHQKDDKAFQNKIKAYMNSRPEILHFVPSALALGDSLSRDLALKLADMSAHPALLATLKDFALGREGPDTLRLEASQILSKHGIFESGKSIDLWLQGEWRPILMFGFQISPDPPEQPTLRPAAQRLMEQAIHALREKNGSKAEGFLRKALELQPQEPSLLNNLAVALNLQGKNDESEDLADRITERFPDYFFGQAIAARRAIHAGDLEKAKTIVDKMMKKQELHVSEFGILCMCQIELMIADDKPEGAISWFETWKQGYPDDPAIENYEHEMAMLEVFSKLKDGFPGSRRKTQKGMSNDTILQDKLNRPKL